jgi:outer membrane immunogenic protein
MRRLLAVLCWLALISHAFADDFDLGPLRGSNPFVPAAPVYTNWSGFYIGGQAGYGNAHMDFSGASKSLVQTMLQQLALENQQHVSEWVVLGKSDNQGSTYGGFFGYNGQWDNLVLGFDVNFSRSHFFADAPSVPLARVTSAGGNAYFVQTVANASMRVDDFATARGRVGYVMNNFMPYGTFGFAVGQADLSRTVTVSGFQNPPVPFDPAQCGNAANPTCVPFSFTSGETKRNAFIFGYALGAGMDVLVLPNIFLRAEYEYVGFGSVAGMKASINNGRVGIGYKF